MSPPKQKAPIGRSSASSSFASNDPRFASLQTDPRFRLPSRKHTHTKLDNRFARILKNDDFSKKASVDRYGRKLEKGAGRKELERLYQLEDEEDAEEVADDDEVLKELKRMDRRYDPAREGGFSDSSSEEESNESEEEEEEEEIEVEEAEIPAQDKAAVPMGEVSSRLAVVNMDWDNIRADDLMAVASSFAPPEGRILSVTVYPSEFGHERMEREELEGPPKDIFTNGRSKTEEDEDEDEDSSDEEERIKKDLLQEDKGEEYNSTALRRYQLDRLRYYYAIIHCSSPAVAKALYDDMDGREYLSSANFFDLRFVPDEVSFDETPRDICDHVPRDYKPTEFVTDALTHSNVKLTWDADDKQRKEVQKRAFSRREIDENDLQAYIGSASSSEDESDEEIFDPEEDAIDGDTMSVTSKSTVNKQAKRDAMRAALGLPAEPVSERSSGKKGKKEAGPIGNMQVSFTPGLSASGIKPSVFENDPRDVEESTLEKYVRKERERKQKRKERAKARREGQDPTSSSDEEQTKAGAEVEEEQGDADGDMGFDDPFFTDPMAAEKESKKARKAEKARQRAEREAEDAASKAQRAELELLMAGDEDNVRHFDMRDIKKQEKAAKLKGKKGKNKKNKGGEEENDGKERDKGFKMDVEDPRFKRLFESHEFAIDPTNPRFKKTEGMAKLMEEGRRKRAGGHDEGLEEKRKKVKMTEGDDLRGLVEKVKKKVKR